MPKKVIYLDHAATTPLAGEVLQAMLPYMKEEYGNPSSLHAKGQSAKNALEDARTRVAKILWCENEEVIFTSGGSESDNLALKGVLGNTNEKKHLIISEIEHHAILHTAEELERKGVEVTKIKVAKNGIVKVDDVLKAIKPHTRLISIMLANNEIGSIQPIREIGKALEKMREKGTATPLLHTDAVQGGGILDLNTKHLKVDLLSLSAHKFYGPKGVGILFKKKDIQLVSQIVGGAQERGLRAGTENVSGIIGCAKALEIAEAKREKEFVRLMKLRDYFVTKVLKEIPRSQLNGDAKNRLPNSANFSFYGIEGESILLRLDFEGICASSGSACTSGSLDPSHVLQALKIPHEWMHGSIRFSLGKDTEKRELDFTVKKLKKIVKDLREISPIV